MKKHSWLRLIGGLILLVNLMLAGRYNLGGVALLLVTFGFAIFWEYVVVRPVARKSAASAPDEGPR